MAAPGDGVLRFGFARGHEFEIGRADEALPDHSLDGGLGDFALAATAAKVLGQGGKEELLVNRLRGQGRSEHSLYRGKVAGWGFRLLGFRFQDPLFNQ